VESLARAEVDGADFSDVNAGAGAWLKGSFGLVLTTEQHRDVLHTTKRRAPAFRLSTEYL